MDRNLKELEKEMKALGIVNIATSDELTPEFAREAIDAVKSIDIDFEEIASQIESNKNGASSFTTERVAMLRKNIDFSDIPEIKDFSGGHLRNWKPEKEPVSS